MSFKRSKRKLFLVIFLVICLGLVVFGVSQRKIFKEKAATGQTQIYDRVYVVNYYGGHDPSSSFDYSGLANNIINDLNNASRFHGYNNPGSLPAVNFQIVKTTTLLRTASQLGSGCDQYLSKVQSGQWTTNDWQTTNCWGSGTANYNTMLLENNVCDLINSNQIDEVWFFGFGNAGFWEANMTGNGAFSTNGPIVDGTNCNRPVHIMGFNYELPADYALHSFGHRFEGSMRNYLPGDFAQFTIYSSGGNSSCGNVHFPPNGRQDYDYDNQTTNSNSDCMNWNVNHTGGRTSLNCTEWGCNQLGYMMWWMQNIPSSWWNYVISLNNNIGLKIKLQGITSTGSPKSINMVFRSINSGIFNYGSVALNSDGSGAYSGIVKNLPTGSYDVYIKESSHLQKKFGQFFISSNDNNLDLSSQSLLGGDFNNDNKIDIGDLAKFLSIYTQLSTPVNSNNQIYDVNSDGQIDISDIAFVLSNYTQLEVLGD
jgi:hypothetical protein